MSAADVSAYRGRRVLVTGATGLIGSALVHRLLELGAEVHAFVFERPEAESALVRSGALERTKKHVGRLEDVGSIQRAVTAARPQLVFHLAAQPLVGAGHADPGGTFEVNAAGTWRLLEAIRSLEAPPEAIAIASSDKAYGASEHLPYRESDPIGAADEPYEASKAVTDIVARTFAHAYDLPIRVARCGNVYGPGDWNWSRLVPGTLRSLLRGERPLIRSDGTLIREYIHVDDVAAGYLALASAPLAPGEAFNFGSGEKLTVLELVSVLQETLGTRLEPDIRDEARGEIPAQWLDSTKARTVLGWTAHRRLRETIPAVAGWYRELLA